MDQEMLSYLTHAACNRIDKIIDAMPKPADERDFAEVNRCIQRVRNHLESRAMQTAVPFVPPTSEMLGDAPARPVAKSIEEYNTHLAVFGQAQMIVPADDRTAELNALLGL